MIVVFGSINLDLVTPVPRIPEPGETVLGGSYARSPGGKGANQALAARRAGAQIRLVGAVGRDAFATAATSLLRAEGVDLSGVAEVALPTGAAFIGVDPQGRNAITVAAGANAAAEGARIGTLAMTGGDLLLLQREVPDAQGEAAAHAAKAGGARVVLNLAPSGAVSDGYLTLVDILILNERESADLAGHRAIDAGRPDAHAALANCLRSRFGIDIIVTLGARGAVGWCGGVEHRVPAPTVTAVDTTGAGDTFVGSFAAALADGLGFALAMRRGVVAGALACTRRGAQPGIPTRAEIDAALERHGEP